MEILKVGEWFQTQIIPRLYDKERKKKIKKTTKNLQKNILSEIESVEPHIITSGSFARDTDLPDTDVDFFVLVNEQTYGRNIPQLKDTFHTIISRLYPRNSRRGQSHTVHILLSNVDYDILPAIPLTNGRLLIAQDDESIETDSINGINRALKCNKDNFGRLSLLSRIIKFWKFQNNIRFSSYYLELIIMHWLNNSHIRKNKLHVLVNSCFTEVFNSIEANNRPQYFSGTLPMDRVTTDEKNRISRLITNQKTILTSISNSTTNNQKINLWKQIFHLS